MAETTREKLAREMTHWAPVESGPRVPEWLADLVRGASYLPYRLAGTPTDLGLLFTNAAGLTDPDTKYAGSSDWIIDLAAKHGLAAPRRGTTGELIGDIGGQIAMPGVSPAEMGAYAKALPFLLGTFGGMGAKTADTDKLAKAFELEQAGKPMREVWQETGWFRAPWDQKWRFEINDKGLGIVDVDRLESLPPARLVGDQPRYAEVISHKRVTDAYPEIGTIYVGTRNTGGGSYKAFRPTGVKYSNPALGEMEINLNAGPLGTEAGPRGIGLHETQHAIQGIEGFAAGGSPESVGPLLKNQAYALRQKAWEKFDEELKGVEGARGQGLALEKEARRLEDLATIAEYAPHHMYQRLAGEAEARLVQARRDLTPEMRGLLYPLEQMDTMLKQEGFAGGLDDLIVRYGDGPAMSAPKIERYAGEVTYRADPDEYVYHVTTAPKAKRILEKGFDPKAAKTVKGGFYENYSKGKVFFTDKDGLGFWRDRIEEHLEQAMDNPPELTVLRVKKSDLPGLPSWAPPERLAQWRNARENAALPVEQGGLGLGPANTAAERAKAGGFEGGWGHGSPSPDITEIRASATGAEGPGGYATDFLPETSFYSGLSEGATAYPLMVRAGRALDAGIGNPYDLLGAGDDADLLAKLRATGNDSILREQGPTSEWLLRAGVPDMPARRHFVSNDPSAFRSRFAAFDPLRRDEADLLASWLLPLTVGGGLLGGYLAYPGASNAD